MLSGLLIGEAPILQPPVRRAPISTQLPATLTLSSLFCLQSTNFELACADFQSLKLSFTPNQYTEFLTIWNFDLLNISVILWLIAEPLKGDFGCRASHLLNYCYLSSSLISIFTPSKLLHLQEPVQQNASPVLDDSNHCLLKSTAIVILTTRTIY